MKIFHFLFALSGCVLLNSCLDTEEKITVNEDGSGIYNLSINMDGMLSQLKAFGQQQSQDMNLDDKDTTIFFHQFVDTAAALTADEKALLHDGSMRIYANEAKDEMQFAFNLPFKEITQVAFLKEHLSELIGKMDFVNKAMKGANATGNEEDNSGGLPNTAESINPFQKAFSFTATTSMISNTMTDKNFITNTLAKDSSMAMLIQMAPMMGNLNYKTTLILPRVVKHYSGNNILISDDKKTVSFSSTLTDIFEKPEILEYRIEY